MTSAREDDDDFTTFKSSSEKKKEKNKEKHYTDTVNGDSKARHDTERREKHDKDRHKDKKDRDKDRDRKHRDKHGEEKKRERTHDKERKKHKKHKDDRERRHRREEGRRSTTESGSESSSSQSQSSHLSSILLSPSRRTPTPRLTVEERMFQRELEAALAISKADSQTEPPPVPAEPNKREEGSAREESLGAGERSKAREVMVVVADIHRQDSPVPHDPDQEAGSPQPGVQQPQSHSNEAAPVMKMDSVEPAAARQEVQHVTGRPPQPHPDPTTSNCCTGKRQRKTVVFKEDSESDFDGFSAHDGGESDFSAGSDFSPSPKKKKVKEKKTQKSPKNNTKQPKAPAKSSTRSKNTKQQANPTPTAVLKENSPPPFISPSNSKGSAKLTSSAITSPIAASPVTSKPSVTPNKPTAKATKPPAARPPLSPGNARVSSGLVKTPFKNPLSQPASTSNSTVSPRTGAGTMLGSGRGTGLRLGLSRRAQVKPLHPSVAGRLEYT